MVFTCFEHDDFVVVYDHGGCPLCASLSELEIINDIKVNELEQDIDVVRDELLEANKEIVNLEETIVSLEKEIEDMV